MSTLVLGLVIALFIVGLPALTGLVLYVLARPDIEIARAAKRLDLKRVELQMRALEDQYYDKRLEESKDH